MGRGHLVLSLVLLAACTSSGTPVASAPADAGVADGLVQEGQQVGPGAPFKTYVILGDSISDRGGKGPFFYDLLKVDLQAKLPDLGVVKGSKAGSVSDDLPGQATKLPAELPGPVAVTVTIGGNDMQDAALAILQGDDAKQRTAYGANLVKAYDELTHEGRFGEGVKVTIFHANIYDPTGGAGDFAEAGCPGYLGAFPKQPTDAYWDSWNKEGADAIAKYGAAVVTVDIRAKFRDHGVGKLKDGTSWFAPDCIHPNTTGHDELRKLFSSAILP